jgi:hypothetical protein
MLESGVLLKAATPLGLGLVQLAVVLIAHLPEIQALRGFSECVMCRRDVRTLFSPVRLFGSEYAWT